MKTILLATASIVAFVGAAAAQGTNPGVTIGGDASFGFNESEDDPDESGFFFEADLNFTFETALDNGLVARSTFSIPVVDNNIGNEGLSVDDDFILGLTLGEDQGLFLGDTEFAAERHFVFDNMQSADFSEQDGEITLRGDSAFGNVRVSASAIVADQDGDQPGERALGAGDDIDDYIDQISVGSAGTIGRFAFSFGYQEESDIIIVDEDEELDAQYDTDNDDFNTDEQVGLSLGTAFAGFDVQLGYGRNLTRDTDSYGVAASFPVGAFTLGAEYIFEPDSEAYGSDTDFSWAVKADYESGPFVLESSFGEEIGEEEIDVKVGYAFSDLLTLQAGYNDDDGSFVAVRQGIGGNAYVEASYAEIDDAGFDNEDYAGDIREGSTLKVGLVF